MTEGIPSSQSDTQNGALHQAVRKQLSDEDLAAAYAESGDDQAIRVLVERHQERVFGYLVGMVRDREVANDLFQETFFRVVSALRRKRASYSHQGRFIGWVMRIARNAALDHIRTRKRWQDMDAVAPEDGLSFWDRLPDDGPSAEEAIQESSREDWLRSCIDRLPPEQREVLLLRHESDLTFREIASLTDCSINTALGRMRYALLNMRRMLPEKEMSDLRTLES